MSTSLKSGRLASNPLSTISKNSLLRSLSWTFRRNQHRERGEVSKNPVLD